MNQRPYYFLDAEFLELVSVANNPGLRRMIAGSVANNVGLSRRQLHIYLVEKCADCWFSIASRYT
jgi:hypothetical protein